jgi:hypothetical protein
VYTVSSEVYTIVLVVISSLSELVAVELVTTAAWLELAEVDDWVVVELVNPDTPEELGVAETATLDMLPETANTLEEALEEEPETELLVVEPETAKTLEEPLEALDETPEVLEALDEPETELPVVEPETAKTLEEPLVEILLTLLEEHGVSLDRPEWWDLVWCSLECPLWADLEVLQGVVEAELLVVEPETAKTLEEPLEALDETPEALDELETELLVVELEMAKTLEEPLEILDEILLKLLEEHGVSLDRPEWWDLVWCSLECDLEVLQGVVEAELLVVEPETAKTLEELVEVLDETLPALDELEALEELLEAVLDEQGVSLDRPGWWDLVWCSLECPLLEGLVLLEEQGVSLDRPGWWEEVVTLEDLVWGVLEGEWGVLEGEWWMWLERG